jgi:hypothetical protein
VRQQVQVVIAQHGAGVAAQIAYQPQHLQRLRPAIDQITGKQQLVAIGFEVQSLQQRLEFVEAALDVADGVSRHR